jgi:hypothetical protein
MKIKSIISPYIILLIFFLLGLSFNSLAYLSTISGTSFFEKWLILQTFGLSLFLLIGISIIGGLELPTNFYKTDEHKFFFFNNNYDILVKSLLFVTSGAMIYYGNCLEPENAILDLFKSTWFEIIYSYLIVVSIFGQASYGIYTLIRNRKDNITIDSKEIYWFDDQTGARKLEIESIEKVIISENEIVFHTFQSSEIMSLKNMSLLAFKDKIKEVIYIYIDKNKINPE